MDRATYTLQFSHGEELRVAGDGVVGRNPSTDGAYTHVIQIVDENRMLSREHFEFGVTSDHQLWAADLGSTNGTILLTGQQQTMLTPHERTAVGVGTTILFGDSAVTVVAASRR